MTAEALRNPKNWSSELDYILQLAKEPGMNTARLLSILQFYTWQKRFQGKKNELTLQLAESLSLRRYKNRLPIARIGVVAGFYSVIPSHMNNEMIIPAIMDEITDETDLVVELGCGWGRNLFALRNLLAHTRPNLKFAGGELSETGLQAARAISELDSDNSNISFHAFDYLAPSLEFAAGFKKVLFFTCHSIEQVEFVAEDLIQKMAGVAPGVDCIHCEPVGWQMNGDIERELEAGGALNNNASMKVPIFGPVNDHFSAAIPVKMGWNRNLVSVVQRVAESGAIRVNWFDRSCGGETFYNPSTLISWSKS
jgi:hypothetical protein